MAEWTDARKRAFIISVLRSGTRRFPPKYETLSEAYCGIRYNEKTKRNGKHYVCRTCEGEYPAKEVNVDHIKPVVDPEVGFVDWNTYVENMFCSKDNLQVLCKTCHNLKTQEERKKK